MDLSQILSIVLAGIAFVVGWFLKDIYHKFEECRQNDRDLYRLVTANTIAEKDLENRMLRDMLYVKKEVQCKSS